MQVTKLLYAAWKTLVGEEVLLSVT